MPNGRLQVELPDGGKVHFGNGDGVKANIRVVRHSFFTKSVLYGDIGFAEAFIDGDWQTDNIGDVVKWFIANIEYCSALTGKGLRKYGNNVLRFLNKLYHTRRRNTIDGSRRNISEHYDLGNEFYSLFLDDTMTYSSGIFRDDSTSLELAQYEKYDRLCRMLSLQAGDHVLEIGTGWGGFAVHAARNYGCRITTTTISKEQYKYAQERVEKEGLSSQIELLLQDYRTLTGKYDKIVSIEMLEAVGHDFIPTYFRKIDELLTDRGSLALQVITSQDKRYHEFRDSVDFIQKHIFPGSQTPSVAHLQRVISAVTDLNLYDVRDIGLDYARTLKLWHEAFNQRLTEVKRLGMSDGFIRKWNYYLQYCEAAFATRHITVKQLVYSRPYGEL